ncbi:tubulin beta chain isoform X2 [Halyomorpha halys]|uniref:tubulin beta chain isoform X2 n=1 Tax=Halyomorpha halys TaxID=286706 RepID=UPI0006D4D999|nr:tubulin beta chain-like isoform X2 [Halyomorpha halys]
MKIEKHYSPRCACLDLDQGVSSTVQSGPYGHLINSNNILATGKGTGNNWAKGYYTDGQQELQPCLDLIRRHCEAADCLQGFQVSQSLGGGTGSGFGSLILQKLYEEYPDRIVSTYSVIPSVTASTVVVEPYNCVLGVNILMESASEAICMDNEAMNDICLKNLKISFPSIRDVNHLICSVMAGITACFRFPGQLNTDLRKIMTNMVPFPRLSFFTPSLVPLMSRGSKPYYKISVPSLVQNMFDPNYSMCHLDPKQGKILTAAAIFRGRMSPRKIDQELLAVQDKHSSWFAEWVPNNIKNAICDIPPRGTKMSATFICNNTAITETFRKQVGRFRSMLKKKAFIHWYTGEGMEEKEFIDAETNVVDLISQYVQYQDDKGQSTIEIGEENEHENGKEEADDDDDD